MRDDTVKTKAEVLSKVEEFDTYTLSNFDNPTTIHNNTTTSTPIQNLEQKDTQPIPQNNLDNEKIFKEISLLNQQINNINQSISTLKDLSFSSKDIDAQVIKALKDLKQYASFYKEAILSFEQKLLKTSFSIAKKIINIEISQNSANIAKETIDNLMLKLKNASSIKIHLNPKDYTILKEQIEVNDIVTLVEDSNVMPGGVVIASDLGNFDGNIDTKIESILQTLDLLS
jgi:flagellar assembly protein FliH